RATEPRHRRGRVRPAAGPHGTGRADRIGAPALSHLPRRHRCRRPTPRRGTLTMKRIIQAALRGTLLALAIGAGAAQAQNAICYNCPPEWADWATQLKAIKEATGITVPGDNKNSGQALASIAAEKANP